MNKERSTAYQIVVLFARVSAAFFGDWKKIAISTTAPIGITAIIIGFCNNDRIGEIYEDTRFLLFIIVASAIYMGMFNTLTIICKERDVIKREYMTGMSLMAYVSSTLAFQAILVAVQTSIFTFGYWTYMKLDFSTEENLFGEAFVPMWISIFLIMLSADALGLIISCIAPNAELANLAAPLVIVFQMVLSGVLFPLKGWKKTVSYGSTSKWGMDVIGSILDLLKLPKRTSTYLNGEVERAFPQLGVIPDTEKSIYANELSHVVICWAVLALMTILLSLMCAVVLRLVEKEGR